MQAHEETRELLGERDTARNNARCTQARKATHAWPERTTSRRGQGEDLIRMTEDRDKWKWRKCVQGVANSRIDDG